MTSIASETQQYSKLESPVAFGSADSCWYSVVGIGYFLDAKLIFEDIIHKVLHESCQRLYFEYL